MNDHAKFENIPGNEIIKLASDIFSCRLNFIRNFHSRSLFSVLFIFFSLFPNRSIAQENSKNNISKKHPKSCIKTTHDGINQSIIIFKNKEYRSFKKIIEKWEKDCEPIEILTRIKILYRILNNSFVEDIYSEYIINHLYNYRFLMTHPEAYAKLKNKKYKELNQITQKVSLEILKKLTNKNNVQYLLALHYSNQFKAFLKEIWKEKYKETKLQKYFIDQFNKGVNKTRFVHFALISSYLLPHSNLLSLGGFMEFGISVGGYFFPLTYNFIILGHFSIEEKSITVINPNTNMFQTSNSFSGLFLGFEIDYEFLKFSQIHFSFIAGIGLDLLILLPPSNNNEKSLRSVSYNFNFGLGGKYFFSKWKTWHLGWSVKYNIVDHKNPAAEDISGNYLTFSLYAGINFSIEKEDVLVKVGY